MYSLLFFLLLTIVSAQKVLIYSSTVLLNGTERFIHQDPLCVTDAIQFNGSASLFAPEKEVWIKQGGLFHAMFETYTTYLANPTVVPVIGSYWVFQCNEGDESGGSSSFTYIPASPAFATVTACHIRLPVVYACEGEVPPTESPSSKPSVNPTIAPSHNPSESPTKQPTRVPTNDAGDKVVGGVVVGILIAVLLWLSGDDRC